MSIPIDLYVVVEFGLNTLLTGENPVFTQLQFGCIVKCQNHVLFEIQNILYLTLLDILTQFPLSPSHNKTYQILDPILHVHVSVLQGANLSNTRPN